MSKWSLKYVIFKKLRNSNQKFIKIGKYSAIYDNIFRKIPSLENIIQIYEFFFQKWAILRQKKGIRIFELFTLTIHYIRISACSYSLTNTNYFCPNYSNNRIFEYRIKNPIASLIMNT